MLAGKFVGLACIMHCPVSGKFVSLLRQKLYVGDIQYMQPAVIMPVVAAGINATWCYYARAIDWYKCELLLLCP